MERPTVQQVFSARVCTQCKEVYEHGKCRQDPSVECPLRLYFPLIVKAVNRAKDVPAYEYVDELPAIICGQCIYRQADDTCLYSPEKDCEFHKYFVIAISASRGIQVDTTVSA